MLAFFKCNLSLSVWLHACLSGLQAEISQIVRENVGVTVRGAWTKQIIAFASAEQQIFNYPPATNIYSKSHTWK